MDVASVRPERPELRILLGVLAVWLTLTGFGAILDYDLTGTDTLLLIAQVKVDEPGDLLRILSETTTAGAKGRDSFFYRPSHLAYLGLLRAAFGWDGFGYHVFALLLHAGNGVLLGLLARRSAVRLAVPAPDAIGLVAAVLFLAHPISMEVVPSDARSADLLHTTLLLAALLRLERTGPGDRGRIAVFCLLFGLTLGMKEHGVLLLPLAVVFVGVVRVDLSVALRMRLLRNALLPCLLLTLLFLLLRAQVLGEWVGGYARLADWELTNVRITKGFLFGLFIPRYAAALVEAVPGLLTHRWLDLVPIVLVLLLAGFAVRRLRSPERDPWLRLSAFGLLGTAGYAAFCILGKVFAPRLLYSVVPFASLPLAAALVAAFRRAGWHSPARLIAQVGLAALLLLLLLQSPLLRRDDEWRSSGDAFRILTEEIRDTWAALPPGSRVYLVNMANAFTYDPGRKNWYFGISTTNAPFYFSLDGWLRDQLPEQRLELVQLGFNNFVVPLRAYRHEGRVEDGRLVFRVPPTAGIYQLGAFPEWVIPGLAPQALDGFEQWLRTENAGPGRVSLHYAGQGSADGRYVLLIDGEKPLLVPFTDLRGTPRP